MDVSIIIPTFNCGGRLGSALKALKDQDFEGNYEIIISDGTAKGPSTDNTRKVAKKFKVRAVDALGGPAKARNSGANASSGRILIFTDDDCVPVKSFIKEMIKPIRGDVVGVQGRYRILNKDKMIARFVQYEIEGRYERTKNYRYIDFIGTYAAAYKRDVFAKLGGFDESFSKASGEDPEFSFRVDKAGYKMVFNPKAIVYHKHPDTLKKYLKMNYGRGYWGRLLYKKHPDKRRGQSYNSVFFFLQIALTGIFGLLSLIFIPFNLLYSLFFLILMFAITIPSTMNLVRFELKFLFLGPILITLKNLAIDWGILNGILRLKV